MAIRTDLIPPPAELREEIRAEIARLSTADFEKLQGKVYQLALKQGVRIADWDHEWGAYHLYDDMTRFSVAWIDLKQEPKASLRFRFDYLREQLHAKFPSLLVESDARARGWKGIELFFEYYPEPLPGSELERLHHFCDVVEELVRGTYDADTACTFLDRLLQREAFHPTAADLKTAKRLRRIDQAARTQVNMRTLQRADESYSKDIYVVPSFHEKLGKLKPLKPAEAANEVHSYLTDRALGFGMTAPTAPFKLRKISTTLNTVQGYIRSAEAYKRQNNEERARYSLNQAFALIRAPSLPEEVRFGIYSEIYKLYGNGRDVDSLGEKLFHDLDAFETSGQQKRTAIANFLGSEAYRSLLTLEEMQGSVQVWIDKCVRGYDLIVRDPEGGSKLKSAPKTLVHLYAMLGLIKGSMDCSSGNSLVELDAEQKKVVAFWDMDDERSMPLSRDWWSFRLWQMGLPQCAQPFDRATLLLFSDPSLVERLKKFQFSSQLSPEVYQAQTSRLETIISCFNEELRKEEVTLTPRELFFRLFGGKQHYEYIQQSSNLTPIELFEFHLAEMGRDCWYEKSPGVEGIDGAVTDTVKRNMWHLYTEST